MAQQVNVRLIDDIDQETADETVRFSVGDRAYVIDLSERHVKELHDALAPFVQHARPAGTRPKVTRSRASRHQGDPAENRRIRDWARNVGISVSDRGRIPEGVVARYRQRDSA